MLLKLLDKNELDKTSTGCRSLYVIRYNQYVYVYTPNFMICSQVIDLIYYRHTILNKNSSKNVRASGIYILYLMINTAITLSLKLTYYVFIVTYKLIVRSVMSLLRNLVLRNRYGKIVKMRYLDIITYAYIKVT